MIAVRVLSDLSDHRRTYYANEVCELEDEVAQRWIAAGWVVPMAPPPLATGAPVAAAPEAAARAAPPETATRPRAEKR